MIILEFHFSCDLFCEKYNNKYNATEKHADLTEKPNRFLDKTHRIILYWGNAGVSLDIGLLNNF